MKHNILIDIDSIMDTRLVMLYSINEELAIEIFNSTYHLRTTDIFGNIPYNLFKGLHDLRNKAILNYAIPTNALSIVTSILATNVADIKNLDENYTIYLNTYPYKLNKVEEDNFTKTIEKIAPDADIEFLYLSKKELTPNIINEKEIYSIIMYDGAEWLEKQNRLLNIVDNPLLGKTLFIPAIVNERLPNLKINRNLFDTISKSLELIMTVIFVDVEYFSPIQKKKK